MKIELGKKTSATTIVMGSVSAVALLSSAGVANADGLYAGLSFGGSSGNIPIQGPGNGDNYTLNGSSIGGFVGYDRSVGSNGMFVGGEVAYSGRTKAGVDQGSGSSYDYGYDVNWTVDAKMRVGTDLGQFKVYGFAGLSTGYQNTGDYRGYQFSGVNYGIGGEYAVNQGFSVGLEAIQRAYNPYGDSSPVITNPQSTTISLRAIMHF